MNENKIDSVMDGVEINPGFCNALMRSVRTYFQDESNERKFREWYLEKYGTPYQPQPKAE
jgi:hypothetical protein